MRAIFKCLRDDPRPQPGEEDDAEDDGDLSLQAVKTPSPTSSPKAAAAAAGAKGERNGVAKAEASQAVSPALATLNAKGVKVNTSSLVRAICDIDLEMVNLLLEARASPDDFVSSNDHFDGLSPLLAAVRTGQTFSARSAEQSVIAAVFAAEQNCTEIVDLLVKANANPNLARKYGDGLTPTLAAAMPNNASVLRKLVEARGNLMSKMRNGQSAIFLAVNTHRRNQTETLRVIVEADVDVNTVLMLDDQHANNFAGGSSATTPLIVAAEANNFEALQLLLDANADMQVAVTRHNEEASYSALDAAVTRNHVEALRCLLEAKGDPDKAGSGESLVMQAVKMNNGGNTDVLQELIRAGANVEFSGTRSSTSHVSSDGVEEGVTPLQVATLRNHVNVLQLLIEGRADVNGSSKDGVTPAVLAATRPSIEALELLVEAKADVSGTASTGRSPVLRAVKRKHLGALRILLKAGADANRSEEGVSPVLFAMAESNLDALTLLLKANGDANLALTKSDIALLKERGMWPFPQSQPGFNPVLAAAAIDRGEALRALLRAKGDPNSALEDGKTPIFIAVEHSRSDAIPALLEAKCDVNRALPANGHTPALAALSAQDNNGLPILEPLLQARADANYVAPDGTSPVSTAASRGNADALLLLLNARGDPTLARAAGRPQAATR